MCDVVAVIGVKEASSYAYTGLQSGQNRGQEGAGISSYDGRNIRWVRNPGLVADAIKESDLNMLIGDIALGHTRYSTVETQVHATQPIVEKHDRFGEFSLVHNGNMVDYLGLEEKVKKTGAYNYNGKPSDTELFARLLSLSNADTFEEALKETLAKAKPTYSMIVQNGDTVYAVRDKHGNRPLSIGKLKEGYAIASEEYDLGVMGCTDIEEIKEGEMIKIYKKERISEQLYIPAPQRCIFELLYLSKSVNNARVFGKLVREIRKESGKQLAIEHPSNADLVIGILGSGYHASLGYSEQSGIPHSITALVRNPRYKKRTFIEPDHAERIRGVYLKFTEDKKEIKGKRIAVVDDSIVRLSTSSGLVGKLRVAGAKGLDFRVASPPIINPCYYGVDFPDKNELIAARLSVPEISQQLTLRFFGVDYENEEFIDIVKGNNLSQKDIERVVEESMKQDKNFIVRAMNKKTSDHEIIDPYDFDASRFSLGYLSEEGFIQSFGANPDEYCLACFNGNYKIEPEIIRERMAV